MAQRAISGGITSALAAGVFTPAPADGESAFLVPARDGGGHSEAKANGRRPRGHDFLRGGGTMGACIRAHDWTTTALGDPDSWPPSLRTAVRLLLATSHAMAIGWGRHLLALHNDAFRRIITADGRPSVVGWPLRELCADLWPRLGPLAEAAQQRSEPAALADQLFCIYRNGFAEEMYLTSACTPIIDERGGVGGVMITIAESTEHVVGTRRTTALRDVAAEAAGARSVVEACRLALAGVARHPSEIPFALVYLREAECERARLAATIALAAGSSASPEVIPIGDAARDSTEGSSSWPIANALEANESIVVDDLLTRFGTLPAGDWPFAPRCAVIIPLTPPGRDEPDGVLVAGVSARHELDAQYRIFLDLIAKQIAAAIAGGRVHEDEERHATARAAAKLARIRRRARLRALKARFAGVLEERTRLAREIHDTLLQGVTGIALQLRATLPHVRSSSTAAADSLASIVELAEKTSREAREAVWDMRPTTLTERDFARALETTARRLVVGARVTVTVAVIGDPRPLGRERQGVVLRIVQEAVANVIRHAAAQSLRLRLTYGARRFRATIVDDGRGFTVESDFRAYAGHWGLLGMQERASNFGGSLEVTSALGRGTTVTLALPYGTPARKRAVTAR